MKNVFGFFVLIVFAVALLIFITDTDKASTNAFASQPCEEPLTYRTGDIDSRFNLSAQQITAVMEEVEELWETSLDRNLLEYKEDGKVVVDLIYSKEQKRFEEEQLFSNQIRTKKEQATATRNEYQRLAKRYNEKESDLKNTVSRYNRIADSYNELAEELQGQNPSQDKIDELNELERQIKNLELNIERKQKNLESLRKQTNAKSEQLSDLIKERNKMIARYNNQFGGIKSFDQGQFIKKGENEAIKVLQFSNRAELKTVLAHEVGHALGINHVNNPKSIMYHKMEKQDIFDLKLTDEDVTALKNQCIN